MGEVKRFFLCTTNITGCKIFGGIQAGLNAGYLIVVIYGFALANDQFDQVHQQLRDAGLYRHKFHQELAELSNTSNTLLIITMVIYSLAILISLMLIAGAMKRNSCLVKTWMVFNGLAILAYAYGTFFNGKWKNLAVLAVAIWSELVAFGALKEINILNTTSNLPQTPQTQSGAPPNPDVQSGAPPNPNVQSGLPTYAQAEAQSGLPYPMTGAPRVPTLQQPGGHI